MKRIAHLTLFIFIVALAAPSAFTQEPEQQQPVYDESADAAADIATALAAAHETNKRVLIQWGANWCGWCKLLHQLFNEDRDIIMKILYEFEVVYVDVGRFDKNIELVEKFGAEIKSIPFLTVLDGEGNVVINQATEPLEEGDAHSPQRVLDFLTTHQAEPLNADDLLQEALREAKRSNRMVFFHSSTPT